MGHSVCVRPLAIAAKVKVGGDACVKVGLNAYTGVLSKYDPVSLFQPNLAPISWMLDHCAQILLGTINNRAQTVASRPKGVTFWIARRFGAATSQNRHKQCQQMNRLQRALLAWRNGSRYWI